ncbi:MAG: acetyl/propionyl/methylcrotonyl-CoA carboxylase subunit alpha [Pseudomonadota bacterium]
MFDTILIANRGEIACRIMRTAQRFGIRCVAIYSDADASALHVEMADQAVHIGGPAPADSYLRGDAIIDAAQATGAQAIHPGYGFLSENPEFVDAVTQAGLTFIGPTADAIRAMGLKDAAKSLMEKAGVPVVPGYHGADQENAVLAASADQIGYPVLIKAVAGGGGKGMRLVEGPGDFATALASARGEAQTAFGNGDVLVEKFIQKPRHIEVQVFGDGTRAVHLFERDCSLQRRHQKVIEEAPAPGMTTEMRTAMGAAAVRAAEAIGYCGAGTVEFIVDGSQGLRPDGFWFMEMNTRLQVEHPVTEAITGLDLVEWQLRVAAGEPLPAAQEDLRIRGHAIEARIYAEDTAKGFLPATGTLTHLRFPADARVDSGVREGDIISPWYDPMIAKLITHGPTRSVALTQLERALRHTDIAGLTTNTLFLAQLARAADFVAGTMDTGTIDRDLDRLTAIPVACSRTRAIAALRALDLWREPRPLEGLTLWSPLHRSVALTHHGEELEAIVICLGNGGFAVDVGDATHHITWQNGGWWLDEAKVAPRIARNGTEITVFWGNRYVFQVVDPLDRQTVSAGDGSVIEAPMPGLVKAVLAEVGARVHAGDRLAILEAMKMEHALLAVRDGVVVEVLAGTGAQVQAGTALVRIEADTPEA